MKHSLLAGIVAIMLLPGCEKEITVNLPDEEARIVVEGTIEPGSPPIVMLTRTQGFFDPTDLSTYANIFVHGATIQVSDGQNTFTLQEICSGSLTPEQIQAIAQLTGIDPTLLSSADVCAYSSLNPADVGVIGRTYTLSIAAEGKTLSSVTTIPYPVALDSTWFRLAEQDPDDDTLGYVWARLTDPDSLGNAYRFMTRRISHDADGYVEDPTFIAPLGSSFYDKFINGLAFDFFSVRGRSPYTDQEEDENDERGKFKVNDTVVVKFVSIGYKEYDFYQTFENNVASQGDLFSTPSNARTNIQGGLGIWAGWAPYIDTVVCVPH